MDHKTLGGIFQEIVVSSLDKLEARVLDSIYRIGSCLMKWKLNDWNTQLRQDTCDECGHKFEDRNRDTR